MLCSFAHLAISAKVLRVIFVRLLRLYFRGDMEISDELLLDFATDAGTDFWDIAAVIACIQEEEEEEKIAYHRSFSLDSLTRGQCLDFFRFTKDQILRLSGCLRMPATMAAPNRTSATGLEVLCIVLRRLAYPCRYVDLAQLFDRPPLEVCFLFNLGITYIDDNYKDRLIDPNQPWLTVPKLLEYSAAVHAKGAPQEGCWGFIDGTVRGMCKPTVHQRLVYNGHKKIHALKFQSVVTPNGLIANMWGPMPGRRHDCALLKESGLLPYMEENCNTPDGRPLWLYGDPAYPDRRHLHRPHRGRGGVILTAAQERANTEMSKVRQCVEWQFGKLITLFAFLDFRKNLKLLKSPIGKLYRTGALLTNCHACLNGNQTAEYFGLQPPVLEEYLY